MTDDQKTTRPPSGGLSNGGGVGGGGRGLEGDLTGPGQGAPAGADDRYPIGMGDDDRSHSGETAGSSFAGGGSGPTTEREDGRDVDVVNAGETLGVDQPGEQSRDTDGPADERGDDALRTYAPSRVEVNRGRMQGLGVGAKDIDEQRDPTGARSSEQYGEGQGGGDER